MPTDASIKRIDEYWARRLGSREDELSGDATVVRSFPADPRHRFNVMAFRRVGGGCVINVHDHLEAQIAHLGGRPADEVFDANVLREVYAPKRVGLQIVAVQAYADASDLRAIESSVDLRRLDSVDDPSLAALRASVSDADWIEASMEEAEAPLFAAFAGDRIVAVAHAPDRQGIRHLGVLTVESERRRGHGRAVAHAVARHYVGHGQIVEWQARMSNTASLAIRDALGFVERYRSITMRVG